MQRPWAIGFAALLLASPSLGATVRAATVTSEYISSPAHYRFEEMIQLNNPSRTAAQNIVARVILLPPTTLYSQVTLTGFSQRPTRIVHDQNGNTVGIYAIHRLASGHRLRIELTWSVVSHAIAYRLPHRVAPYDTQSHLFRFYTNPRFEYHQGVSTDAPQVVAVVRKVTRGLVSPVARARALFYWEVAHIRYNPNGRSAGSAVATLAAKTGICSDFAELYAALLRTDHIPARLISGYATNNGGGQAGFHEWDEFYVPRVGWVVADPTWGHFGYFARLSDDWHVPLYGGVVPDVEVHYASKSLGAALTVSTVYHFTTQSMSLTSPPSKVPLPVLAVALPHNTATAHRPVRGFWHRWWTALTHAIHSLLQRLTHWF